MPGAGVFATAVGVHNFGGHLVSARRVGDALWVSGFAAQPMVGGYACQFEFLRFGAQVGG
ncbi:hypothetical protein HDA40_002149 [Hamadaea flava]|nr:hypothetical protein [Hamadaea flava]